MSRFAPGLFALSLLTLVIAAVPAAAVPGPGDLGGPAPDWTLQQYQGPTHTLSDYQGKVVFMFVVGYG